MTPVQDPISFLLNAGLTGVFLIFILLMRRDDSKDREKRDAAYAQERKERDVQWQGFIDQQNARWQSFTQMLGEKQCSSLEELTNAIESLLQENREEARVDEIHWNQIYTDFKEHDKKLESNIGILVDRVKPSTPKTTPRRS